MIVWSLNLWDGDDGPWAILCLTEAQAYESLAWELHHDEDSEEDRASYERLLALCAGGITDSVVDAFDAELAGAEIVARVQKHEHPWTFPLEAA